MSLLIDLGKLGHLGGAEGGTLGTGIAFVFSVKNSSGTASDLPNTVMNSTGTGFIVNADVMNSSGTIVPVTY